MALSIHTNYSALTTNTALNKSNSMLATNQQRLGTGFRINSAADDAAGLQIATRLNAGSRGMAVAMRNTGDAISLLQTAEGAMNEISSIMQRMKDLSEQAANDTNSAADRTALQTEFTELAAEVDNILTNTSYAGDALFAGGGKFTAAVNFQIGGKAAEKMTIAANVGGTLTTLNTEWALAKAGTMTDNTTATATMGLMDTAMNAVTGMRAQFGASINRLNHTSNNLANMKDNTDMAKGRIMDADFAIESANMSKNSMLMQSGISMLKQAGQMPGMVMSLLG